MLFVRENYPNMHNELFCPLCTSEVEKALDSQEHLLYCKIINMQCKDIIESEIKHEDLYNENPHKQAKVAVILQKRLMIRKKLLAEQEISTDNRSIVTR